MKSQIKNVVLPRLVDKGGDIKKDWYIEYQVWNEKENRYIRFRHAKGVNSIKSFAERKSFCERFIKETSFKLMSGWTPWNDEQKYNDNIKYKKDYRKSDKSFFLKHANNFLEENKIRLAHKSYINYVSKIRVFHQFLESINMQKALLYQIDNQIIKKYFAHLVENDLDRITLEKYVQILKKFFDYCIDLKLMDENPVKNIMLPPKRKDMAARPLNHIDLKILLEEIERKDPQLYLACLFQYYVALRPGNELRLLRIKDIDFHASKIYVSIENGKTGKRTVDVPVQLITLCRKFNIDKFNKDFFVFGKFGIPGEFALGKNTLRNRFNAFRASLNLPDTYKFYSLKHTGGGMLIESGATLEELRNHFGHKSIESTDNYVRRHFGERNKRVIYNFPDPH